MSSGGSQSALRHHPNRPPNSRRRTPAAQASSENLSGNSQAPRMQNPTCLQNQLEAFGGHGGSSWRQHKPHLGLSEPQLLARALHSLGGRTPHPSWGSRNITTTTPASAPPGVFSFCPVSQMPTPTCCAFPSLCSSHQTSAWLLPCPGCHFPALSFLL